MNITIKIKTGNAAFTPAPELETARLLRELADKLEGEGLDPGDTRPLMDVNGTRVGTFSASRR